jgi:hypothetical protein
VNNKLCNLGRAETAALVVETLAAHGIEVVLVGGSCVCVWASERFGSFDLDFVDMTYSRRKEIAVALADIGFVPKGKTKYFEHPDSKWIIEFPTAPLAVGHEQIASERVASLETAMGTIRLLSPTDTIKDRLLWWYIDGDRQCWEQALEIARRHKVNWSSLKKWHAGEGYAGRYKKFREALK